MMSRKGLVYFQDTLAGVLAETDDGYEFTYQDDYHGIFPKYRKKGTVPGNLE